MKYKGTVLRKIRRKTMKEFTCARCKLNFSERVYYKTKDFFFEDVFICTSCAKIIFSIALKEKRGP